MLARRLVDGSTGIHRTQRSRAHFRLLGLAVSTLVFGASLFPTGVHAAAQNFTATIVKAGVVGDLVGEREVIGEYHRWEPGVLVAFKGDTVAIKVKNGSDTPHSFVIPDLNVKTAMLAPGAEASVAFTADKAGVFAFRCGLRYDPANQACDLDHKFQVGYLIVLER